MEHVKNELQHIILGNEPPGSKSKLQKAQAFLRRNAEAGFYDQEQQYLKSEEAAQLTAFAQTEDLIYQPEINETFFISAGAEQRVYRYDDYYILKTNDSIFYKYWLDYFNSLLLHNYFFPATCYEFVGLKIINDVLHAVVKQRFVHTTEATDLYTFLKQIGPKAEFAADDFCLSGITFFDSNFREEDYGLIERAMPNEGDDIIFSFESDRVIRVNCEAITLNAE